MYILVISPRNSASEGQRADRGLRLTVVDGVSYLRQVEELAQPVRGARVHSVHELRAVTTDCPMVARHQNIFVHKHDAERLRQNVITLSPEQAR
jgi:hypothetical protein